MDTDPAPESSRRSGTVGIVIGVVAVLIGFGVVAAVLQGGSLTTTSESFAGVSVIEFDLDNAPVTVRGTGDGVDVERRATTGLLGGTSRYEQSGGTLRVVHRCPAIFGFGCRASFTIDAPAGTSITGATSNGAFRLTDLDGRIDVRTSNGGIYFDGVTAEVRARTSNGAITGSAMSSDDIDVQTSNGRITLSFAEAPDTVRARTSNGRIDLRFPADAPSYVVDASTSNGQVRNEIRSDPASAATLDLATSNGDIILRYGS